MRQLLQISHEVTVLLCVG